jgi:hypothetical protein
MNIWQLVIREILRRKINFFAGLVAVTLAITVLVGALNTLKIHDLRTEAIIQEKERETQQRALALEDDYRKIMKELGFNLLILPTGQSLNDLYADDFASQYMPENYVEKLAQSNIVTIQHLLPSLQQKLFWPEKKRTVILIGTRGEVPLRHRSLKEPMLIPVPPGKAVVGYELHQRLNLQIGEKITLLGREFMVSQCNPERGNKDDITLWIELKTAQEMLDKPGKINAILALKCLCTGSEIATVRSDVNAILPGVQVIEEATKVVTRAEARARAAQEARAAIEAETRNRREIRQEQERFTKILLPLVLFGAGLWIGFLFFANVTERRDEIGIFRAIGIQAQTVLRLFLCKALIIGVIGALLGFILGTLWGLFWNKFQVSAAVFDFPIFLLVLVLAPVFSILAGWIPAFYAIQQDPATVLREE